MSQARHDLALRRERLLARSEQARQQLEVQSAALLPVLAGGVCGRVKQKSPMTNEQTAARIKLSALFT